VKNQKAIFQNLSSDDMALIAKLCERIHCTNLNEPFNNHAFVILKDALPNTYFAVDRYRINPLAFEGSIVEGVADKYYSIFQTYMHQHPFLQILMKCNGIRVSTILTEMTSAEFHETDLYKEFYGKLGVEDQLAFSLQQGNNVYGIVYSRDYAFTERELAMMEVIRPHVQIAWQNWEHSRALEQRISLLEEKNIISESSMKQAEAAKQLLGGLSTRQREVTELVARGKGNREIADTLYISPKTVGKHLENIFYALDIHHRASLAALWQQSCQPE